MKPNRIDVRLRKKPRPLGNCTTPTPAELVDWRGDYYEFKERARFAGEILEGKKKMRLNTASYLEVEDIIASILGIKVGGGIERVRRVEKFLEKNEPYTDPRKAARVIVGDLVDACFNTRRRHIQRTGNTELDRIIVEAIVAKAIIRANPRMLFDTAGIAGEIIKGLHPKKDFTFMEIYREAIKRAKATGNKPTAARG